MADYPIFRSAYTTAQIEALIAHGVPIIQSGTWWRWDIITGAYVDTGLSAEGAEAWHGLADNFYPTVNYVVGEYVMHDGKFYLFISDHPAGAWVASDAMEATVGGELSKISAPTQNVWLWGNQTAISAITTVHNTAIPAGTYTISAIPVRVSGSTAAGARIIFYGTSVTPSQELARVTFYFDQGRQNATITLATECNHVCFLPGPAGSSPNTVVWTEIQLEEGESATEYVPPATATDFVARNDLHNLGETVSAIDTRTALVKTRNLWTLGDQHFTGISGDLSLPLEAGIYTMSAEVHSVRDGVESLDFGLGTARFSLRKSDQQEIGWGTLNRGGCRSSVTFELSEATDIVRLMGVNSAGSAGSEDVTWENIQLESGKYATDYIPPYVLPDTTEAYRKDPDILLDMRDYIDITRTSYTLKCVRKNEDHRNIIITADAMWEGTPTNEYNVPMVRFDHTSSTRYASNLSEIGGEGRYRVTEYRMPPFPPLTTLDQNRLDIVFSIPSGLTLKIKRLTVRYDNSYYRPDTGLLIDAHGAFMGRPEHSIPAFTAIAGCGATRAITIPKRSSDGVWFCYHDDTFDEATTLLRNADGSAISGSAYNGLPFSQIPWSWLKTLDSGAYNGDGWAGLHLAKLSDFFEICNRGGVRPVLSCHPSYSQAETESLFELASLYHVLDKLTLLPSSAWFSDIAYPIFGNQIEQYKMGPGRSETSAEYLQSLFTRLDNTAGLDKSKVCIALWVDKATPELVQMIVDAGYTAGLHAYSHTTPAGTTSSNFTEADYKYWQSLGLKVFTDGHFPHYGLNW